MSDRWIGPRQRLGAKGGALRDDPNMMGPAAPKAPPATISVRR